MKIKVLNEKSEKLQIVQIKKDMNLSDFRKQLKNFTCSKQNFLYEDFELSVDLEREYSIGELNPIKIKFLTKDEEKEEERDDTDIVKIEQLQDEPKNKKSMQEFQIVDPEKCNALQRQLTDLTGDVLFNRTNTYPARQLFFCLIKHWDKFESDSKELKVEVKDLNAKQEKVILKENQSDNKVDETILKLAKPNSDLETNEDSNELKDSTTSSKTEFEKIPFIDRLYQLVNKRFKEQYTKAKEIRSSGIVTYENLEYQFLTGDDVLSYDECGSVISKITKTSQERSCRGDFFSIHTQVIKQDGEEFIWFKTNFSIAKYSEFKLVENLEIKKPNAAQIEEHTRRGKIFHKQQDKVSQLNQTGNLIKFTQARDTPYKLRASGRVMIDQHSFHEVNPDYPRYEQGKSIKTWDHSFQKQCYSRIYGFSFNSKQWGELDLNGLAEIQQDTNIFDRLIMPAETKAGLQLLIRNFKDINTDLIQGKGDGLLFLLHGPPGVGKTLTAEATAEFLHRPLYMVNVGELGVKPDELEDKLKTILEICFSWDAVLLLDEADIFMEARDGKSIKRNAMVGIFIRLLEYYQGIMFLTTNRVGNMDPAFSSRISVKQFFCELDADCRAKIWGQIFARNPLISHDVNYQELAAYNLNGREIKNIAKIALSKCKGLNQKGKMDFLIEEIKNYNTEKNYIMTNKNQN